MSEQPTKPTQEQLHASLLAEWKLVEVFAPAPYVNFLEQAVVQARAHVQQLREELVREANAMRAQKAELLRMVAEVRFAHAAVEGAKHRVERANAKANRRQAVIFQVVESLPADFFPGEKPHQRVARLVSQVRRSALSKHRRWSDWIPAGNTPRG
jgi:hypothetical protein